MLEIGKSASYTRKVTEADISAFAEVSGDFNSAHMDEEEARKGPFGERIAHGMLSAGFISAVIGMQLPGKGTIYLGQTLNFKAPVRINDTVTASVKVKEILNGKKGIYKLETVCTNQDGVVVIDGEAVVKYMDAGN